MEDEQLDMEGGRRVPDGSRLHTADHPVVGIVHQRRAPLLRAPRRVLAIHQSAQGLHQALAVQLLAARAHAAARARRSQGRTRQTALCGRSAHTRADRVSASQRLVRQGQEHAAIRRKSHHQVG